MSKQLNGSASVTTTVHYGWRQPIVDDDGEARLIIPWGDPTVYEYAYDYIFDSPQEAKDFRAEDEAAADEPWVLVKITTEVVE